MRIRSALMALCIGLAACSGAAVHAPQAAAVSDWTRTELLFAIGDAGAPPDRVASDERQWVQFLDREVTPRFPDGLSVYDLYGQWKSRKADTGIHREHSKSLMIVYHDDAQRRADLEAIRAAWKKITGAESVLRITQHIDVSF